MNLASKLCFRGDYYRTIRVRAALVRAALVRFLVRIFSGQLTCDHGRVVLDDDLDFHKVKLVKIGVLIHDHMVPGHTKLF